MEIEHDTMHNIPARNCSDGPSMQCLSDVMIEQYVLFEFVKDIGED